MCNRMTHESSSASRLLLNAKNVAGSIVAILHVIFVEIVDKNKENVASKKDLKRSWVWFIVEKKKKKEKKRLNFQ